MLLTSCRVYPLIPTNLFITYSKKQFFTKGINLKTRAEMMQRDQIELYCNIDIIFFRIGTFD